MPAAAEGHKRTSRGKAKQKVPVDKRGEDRQQSGLARKHQKQKNKDTRRSPSPIPRQRQRPQEKFPEVKPGVVEALNFVDQNTSPENMWVWLQSMGDFHESADGWSQRSTRRKQSRSRADPPCAQAARLPAPADGRRSRADPPEKEHTRSPRASRAQGSRAARGDECASAPLAKSAPKTHPSRGHGPPRRDGELQAPQPAGITNKRDHGIKPALTMPIKKKQRTGQDEKLLRSPSTATIDSNLSDSGSSTTESSRTSLRSRSRSRSGLSSKASGRSARRGPNPPPKPGTKRSSIAETGGSDCGGDKNACRG